MAQANRHDATRQERERCEILLVDDNETFLQHAVRFLEREPALEVVATATCVEDGLQAARALQPDIILIDLSIPEDGGLNAISDFQSAAPAAGLIVLTMHEEASYRNMAQQHGCDAFVTKRDMVDTLITEIEHVCTQSTQNKTT